MSARSRLKSAIQPSYEKLLGEFIDGTFADEDVSLPFVPQVGEEYEGADHKILVIGKVASVTQGPSSKKHALDKKLKDGDAGPLFESLDSYWRSNLFEIVTAAYKGDTPAGYKTRELKTRWWGGIHHLCGPLVGAKTPQETFRRIAWSNVLKVGGPSGNPKSAVVKAQSAHMSILATEIDALEPDAVLFATGWRFDPHIHSAITGSKVLTSAGLSRVRVPRVKASFRSRHFQGFAKTGIDSYRKRVHAELVSPSK